MSEQYNGWANYATWRINLEMVEADGYYSVLEDWHPTSTADDLKYDLAHVIKDNCTDTLREEHGDGLTLDYALAFIDDVNWREIASHIVEDWIRENEQ